MSQVGGLNRDVRPDPEDVLLLRFLLHHDPEEAVAAWRLWRPGWNPDSPTSEQYRLYPLLAERVAALVPNEAALGMLQGVRRQSTIQTLLMLDQLEEVLASLDRIGVRGVVLKGAALALSVYDHVGQRPFYDLDILVDPRRHAQALSALLEQGWTQTRDDFRGNHAVNLERAGVALDLHRKHSKELVLTGQPTSGWDNVETATARRTLRSGRTISILAPADALLHTITHGPVPRGPVVLRWVVDAQRLIVSGDVDWERVVRLTELFEVGPIVHDSLSFFHGTTGISPPREVMLRLKAARVSRFSRRRIASFHARPNVEGRLGGLPLTLGREFEDTMDQPWSRVLMDAPSYWCKVWNLEHAWELPLEIARRALRRRG